MPYVNCPECGVRGFVLAPWSAVGRCPTCEARLVVPRQSMAEDRSQRQDWAQGPPLDDRKAGPEELGRTG